MTRPSPPAWQRGRRWLQVTLLVAAVIAAALWVAFQLLQPLPPRRLVLASGVDTGLYYRYAQRYRALLAEHGVRIDVRKSSGADENYRLLLDPNSGVDIAFMQGGVAPYPPAEDVVMLASIYIEPLWIFYRGNATLTAINQLAGKRIEVGLPGSGTRALVEPLLEINGISAANSTLLTDGAEESLRKLRSGEVDVVLLVGGVRSMVIQTALYDPSVKLMNLSRADAYPRHLRFVTRLTLPPGTIDLAANIPPTEVAMIGTKAMLAARNSLHPALINLLIDAAREIHGEQSTFEAAGEFPGTARVDLPVSEYADQHRRFGRSFLYDVLPFWAAALIERLIILVIPLIVILVPAFNYLPRIIRMRDRSRITRWYGNLALLERDIVTRQGEPPVEKWLQDLEKLSRSVGHARMPAIFANEMFTLLEHIDLVRRGIEAKRASSGV